MGPAPPVPGSYDWANPHDYEPDNSVGHFEPYESLEKHQRRAVDHARESAFKDMDYTWPDRAIFYDGNPIPGEIKGLGALLFMQNQIQCSLMHRKRYPQTRTYISHATMLDYTLENYMKKSKDSPQISCPLSEWYKRLTYEQKNNAARFWELFKLEWINAPQLIERFKTDIKNIDAAQFIHRTTSLPFSSSDFDVDTFIATNKQLMELIELLGHDKFNSYSKFEVIKEQFRSTTARPAWDHFLQRGVRNWRTWKRACEDYKAESLLQPASSMRDRPRIPHSSPGLSDLLNRAMLSSSMSSRSSASNYGRGGSSNRGAFGNIDFMHVSDVCSGCSIPFTSIDTTECTTSCPCSNAIQFLNVQDTCTDKELLGAFNDVLDELHVLTQQPTQTPADPSKSVCVFCQKYGHYVRDCPSLEHGSGISTPGQRFGSAKGFRQGDDPADRPLEYTAWRQEARRLYDEKRRASANTGYASKPRSQGSTSTAGVNTHAKLLRKSHATHPVESRYQTIQRLNVLLSDEAQLLNLIGDEPDATSTSTSTGGSSVFNHLFQDK